jgi:hypothetical protein
MATSAVQATRPKRGSLLLKAFGCAVGLYGIAFGAFDYAMHLRPDQFGQAMKHVGTTIPFLLFPFETMWKQARAGQLKPGDMAPDFTLPGLDGAGSVTLSSFRGEKPVVLVFGSYT